MYHIGYLNANSLHDRKFAQAIGLLEKSFDMLFIAEHWYQHHELRLSHPLVYCSTSRPINHSNSPPRGRSHGGIYLLVKPHIRPLIQSTISTTHSITVSLPGLRFAAVYYPPYSIQADSIKASLHQIGPVDLLLGDINTTFASNIKLTTNRSTCTISSRSLLFQTWAAKSNMVHLTDNDEPTISHKIPDHAFSSIQLQSKITLSLIPTASLPFSTDHKYLLHIQYEIPLAETLLYSTLPTDSCSPSGPLRFHVQRLKSPPILLQYQTEWGIMEEIFSSYKGSECFDVDMLDSILCSAVQAVAGSVLGIYQPAKKRNQPDTTAKRLANQLDINSSIQLLKRAQRASTLGVNLVSSTEQSTPMQECIEHYSKLFNSAIQLLNTHSDRSSSTVSNSSKDYPTPSFTTVEPTSFLSPPDETTLLESGLLDLISSEKIKSQLARMSTSASCGNDGITVVMLRPLLDTSFTQHLFQLYYTCLRKGQTPRRWNEACIFPLCKDKTKPYTASNSRPISLLCLFRKLFESLILPIVKSSGRMTYSSVQAGFRSGYSTLTNVLTLHHQIESDAGSHIVFLDFASAFDRVQWSYLRKELEKQDVNPLVLQLIYNLIYRDMSFSVIVNGCQSPNQERTTGLPQGSPLSPTLFNRFIDSLLQTLNWQNTASFPSSLFFADDGVLVAPTFRKAQSLVNQASQWADGHGMAFNLAKCGYLITHSASKIPLPIRPPLLLNKQAIPFVQSYKYLGVMFSGVGIDFVAQGDMLAQRVEKQLGAMSWFSNLWCPRIRLNIMKSILLPTLEYSLPLLFAQFQRNSKSHSWKQLNTAYNNCLKWIAGGNANRPHITSHLLGLLPFKERAQHLHSRFYLHLMAMDSPNPLLSILNSTGWYPKSNRYILIHPYDPLLYQFLNPPPAFTKHLPTFQQTPLATLRHNLLNELALQKSNHILSITYRSQKLLQISMLTDRVPKLDCDVVLTAPASDQGSFFAWRRGIWGWGRKCICGKRFDRGHTSCMPTPSIHLTEMEQRLLNLDHQLLDPSLKYTLVDFLLNQRLWEKARNILDFWTLSMSYHLKLNPLQC